MLSLTHRKTGILSAVEVEKIKGIYFASTDLCGGLSFEKDLAVIRAIGEGVERYASNKYNLNQLPFGSYEQLQRKYKLLRPAELFLFSKEQYQLPNFPFIPFTTQTETHWIEAREMLGRKKVYIPAFFVFLSYQRKECREQYIIPTSSGTACHGSFEDAALSAIYELIERDATLGMWDKSFAPPQITPPLEIKKAIKKNFKEETVTFYDLKTDLGIPVVMAKCRGLGFSSFGSACHFTYKKAMEKALLECFQTAHAIKNLEITQKPENEINDFIDHLLFYAREEHQKYLTFLDQGVTKHSRKTKKVAPTLAGVLKAFADNNLGKIYLADITPLQVKASGLHVVRARP